MYAALTCWCVPAHAKFVCMINIKGKNSTEVMFIKNRIKNGLHLYTYELISFKLGMMMGMTKLYILIPVGISLTFTQGLRVTRKLKLLQPFRCKVA